MIPDEIKPLLRKTIELNGTILNIEKTKQTKSSSKVYIKSSNKKRYFIYTLTNIRYGDLIVFKRFSIKLIKSDLPIEIDTNSTISFTGRIVPYIDGNKVSIKLSNVKVKGLFTQSK